MVVVPGSGARTENSRVCRHTFLSRRGTVTLYTYQSRRYISRGGRGGVNMNMNATGMVQHHEQDRP